MPRVSSQTTSGYWEPEAVGPVAQCDYSSLVPGTLAGGGSFDTGIIYADGFKAIAIGVLMSQAGTLSIQRFLDAAGKIPQGAVVTQAVTANAPAVLNVNDNLPFNYVQVKIINGAAGAVATLAAAAILLNAN